MIETGLIKMSSKQMLSVLFLQNGTPWLVIACVGLVVFVVLGILLNPRFYILTLIWLFMFVPIVVPFLYFYYGMMPLTAFNSLPHKITFDDQGLTINLIEISQNEEIENINQRIYKVSRNFFNCFRKTNGGLIMDFGKQGWLWLPFNAFKSTQDLQTILKTYER